MDAFRFHDPQYFWLLLLPLGLFFFSRTTSAGAKKRLAAFAKPMALLRLIRGSEQAASSRLRRVCLSIAMVAFIVTLARPQANPRLEEHDAMGLDIMVVLDVSRSMDSEDIYPSRLKKAKREINTMMDHLGGDRVGIVAFAGSAVLVAPLTSDYEVVRSFLENVDTSTIQNQGTNIAEGINVALAAFQRGAENGLSKEDHSNLILLMSDGESHEGTTFEAVEQAKKMGITIFTIALGTEKGVPIPIRDSAGQLLSYKRNRRGEDVVSKVNPDSLKQIAEAGGGVFYFATLDEGEISDILKCTESLQRAEKKEVKAVVYEELFTWTLSFGVIALLITLLPVGRVSAKASVLVFLCLLSVKALAEEEQKPEEVKEAPATFQRHLWDKNKQLSEEALRKYQAGKFSEATDILKSLQVENPNSSITSFDFGTSLLKEKKYEEGRATLSEAAKANDIGALAARFNAAGSYAEEQKNPEAQSLYSELIHDLSVEKNRNKAQDQLLERAKKNLEMLSNKEQQNQQKQQNKQDQKKEQKPEDKKESKPKEQQDQKNGEPKEPKKEQGEQDKKEYDHQKHPFQERQDMSEQDAKRMLEALKQQESGTQKKFLKKLEKQSKVKENESGNDW